MNRHIKSLLYQILCLLWMIYDGFKTDPGPIAYTQNPLTCQLWRINYITNKTHSVSYTIYMRLLTKSRVSRILSAILNPYLNANSIRHTIMTFSYTSFCELWYCYFWYHTHTHLPTSYLKIKNQVGVSYKYIYFILIIIQCILENISS